MKQFFRRFAIILMLLTQVTSLTAYAAEGDHGPGMINLDGLEDDERVELIRIFTEETNRMRSELENAREKIVDGELYYQIGDIGGMIAAWAGVISIPFLRFRGSKYYQQKVIKNNFGPGCVENLAQARFDALLKKHESKLKKRGSWLKFRKYTTEQIEESQKAYEVALREKMTLTEDEIIGKVADFTKRKKIAWGVFIGSLGLWGGFKITENSAEANILMNEERKKELEEDLERQEKQLHNLQETYMMFQGDNSRGNSEF